MKEFICVTVTNIYRDNSIKVIIKKSLIESIVDSINGYRIITLQNGKYYNVEEKLITLLEELQ